MDNKRETPQDRYRAEHGTGVTSVEGAPEEDERIKFIGGGMFELTNGDHIRGRDEALAAQAALDDEAHDDSETTEI